LQKCHAKGQKFKLDKMKVWIIVNLFNFERKQPMRFKTFNCWEALRHNKTHAKTPVFKIDSAEITCDEVVKLLGIDIDYQLNWALRYPFLYISPTAEISLKFDLLLTTS
jgi:hypothetical protein